MSARTEDTLQAVAEEINSGGGEAVVVMGDVSKVPTLRDVAEEYPTVDLAAVALFDRLSTV